MLNSDVITNLPTMTNADALAKTQQMLDGAISDAISNATTLVTNSNNALPLHAHPFCPSVSIIGIMFLGMVIGSIGSVCYEMAKAPVESDADSKKKTDKPSSSVQWQDLFGRLGITMGMGVAAVALVPAFLRTVSSNLIKDAQESFESKLVLFAFCVAATLIAKKLIGTLPEQLFNLAKDAKKRSVENEATTTKLLTEFANRTATLATRIAAPAHPAADGAAPEVPGPATAQPAIAAPVAPQNHPLPTYNYPEFLVMLAFLNPRYPDGRTTVGLAMDTGLTMGQVAAALNRLTIDGHIRQTELLSRDLNLWQLTNLGRNTFSGRITAEETGGLSPRDVGIQ
jgi:hypothetical protein